MGGTLPSLAVADNTRPPAAFRRASMFLGSPDTLAGVSAALTLSGDKPLYHS